MAKEHFSIGSIVKLKSGGPPMTVTGAAGEDEQVHCTWFAAEKLLSHTFSWNALLSVPAKELTTEQLVAIASGSA
jgi:uncharacterized protein YodC (DUF2158 family)